MGTLARRGRLAAVAACLAAALLVVSAIPLARMYLPSPGRAPARANVVVVVVDDLPKGMLGALPKTRELMFRQGTYYSGAVMSTSTCCPSRSSLFTGLFATGTGVFVNEKRYGGGWPAFARNGNRERTLAVRLSKAGYATGLFGKYLNGYYPAPGDPREPGWDQFEAFVAHGHSGAYRDYLLTSDPPGWRAWPKGPRRQDAPVTLSGPHREYSTSLLGSRAAEFLRAAPPSRPVFAVYAPYGAHAPFRARSECRARQAPLPPRGTMVSRAPVAGKPAWVRGKPVRDTGFLERRWARQAAAACEVDGQIARLVAALQQSGRWDSTLFAVVSDNGLSYGQQRLLVKNTPYRAATDVDLMVRYPGQEAPAVEPGLVAGNVDLAATVLATAGLATDGLDGVVLPRDGGQNRAGVPLMAGNQYGAGARPAYCGWRTRRTLFVQYASGERELYDLRSDPFEEDNLAGLGTRRETRAARAARNACKTGMTPDFGNPWDWAAPELDG